MYSVVPCMQLISGSAEVFGTELAVGKVYTICSRLKIAVFTWYGCTLRISSPLNGYTYCIESETVLQIL